MLEITCPVDLLQDPSQPLLYQPTKWPLFLQPLSPPEHLTQLLVSETQPRHCPVQEYAIALFLVSRIILV